MTGLGIGRAVPDDLAAILPLVAAYHRLEGIATTEADRARAVATLLAGPELGEVWTASPAGRPVGYLAVCLGCSLEFGGRDAFVDEVYVEPGWRGRGIATALLRAAASAAHAAGILALHLEVDRHNATLRRLYERAGFRRRDRYHLMTRRLGPPAGSR